jgi:transcriptional regulator with XRE-family HTH domain
VERGAKTPSFDAIGKLAHALGVEYWQLFLADRRLMNMEKDLTGAIAASSRVEPQDIEEFLRTLRTAIRKLDRRSSASSTRV